MEKSDHTIDYYFRIGLTINILIDNLRDIKHIVDKEIIENNLEIPEHNKKALKNIKSFIDLQKKLHKEGKQKV